MSASDPSDSSFDAQPVDRHDAYLALRFRDFRFLFTSSFLSVLGALIQSTALGWDIYNRTNDVIYLGYVGLAQVLPAIIFSLFAGHIADRYDRKRVALIAQCILMVCSASLIVLSITQSSILLIYVLLFLRGTAQAFNEPAYGALLPQTVPSHAISSAINWNMAGFHIAAITGPALAGAVIALTGTATWCYALDAGMWVLIILSVAQIKGKPYERSNEELSVKSLLAGARFIWRDKIILASITLDLFAVLFGGAVTLLPVFARDVLHVDEFGYGVLRSAPSLGALLMALTMAHLPPMKQAGRNLLVVVIGFGVATIIFGLSQSFILSAIALAATGALDNVSMVIRGALVQLRTPDDMRGRVGAVNGIFISSSNELGGFESGLVAKIFGPVMAAASGGVLTIAVVLTIMWIWPQLRHLGELKAPEPEEVLESAVVSRQIETQQTV